MGASRGAWTKVEKVIAAIVEKCEVGLVWKEGEGVMCRREEEREKNN
jgi:hypothetical protein